MVEIMQPYKVVLVTHGRYAGKKAVIVKAVEKQSGSDKDFGYAIIAGIARPPLKVSKGMSKSKIHKRSRIKPFIKTINYNHLLPTRYKFEVSQVKDVIKEKNPKDPANLKKIRKELRKIFETKYKTGQYRWFFEKLRF